MNAKKAKLLRQAAGYKNQSKTPGVMDFPGVSRVARAPALGTHEVIKTSYCRVPLTGKFIKVESSEKRLTLRNNKPVVLMHTDGVDKNGDSLAATPKLDLVPMTNPGKLRLNEPKGSYRQLKKLDTFGPKATDIKLGAELADKERALA